MALRNGSGKTSVGSPDPAAKPIRCAIYTRKSTDEGLQQEFNSLDAQREAGEAYVLSQRHEGWQLLPARYDDGGYTGGNMERPGLKKLLADIETAKVDCVVVYKVDRLSRSLMDFARIIEIFDKRGVSFVSVTQQFNTTNSLGRLTLHILLSFAQFEREIISERTRDKQSAARRKGKWIGGQPVLGYDIDPRGGRLVVNEAEAVRVRGMFDLYLEHQAAIAVVDELRRRDWRTKNWLSAEGRAHGDKPFTKNRLYGLLTNVLYAGKINHKGTIYEGEQDGIVEVKTWDRVQAMLGRGSAAQRDRTRNKYGALLHGLVVCATCDAPMISTYTMRGAKRYRYYVCLNAQQRGWNTCETKSVAAHAIEGAVIESIRRLGSDPEIARRTVEHARAQVSAKTEQLRKDETEARQQLRRLNMEMACAATVSSEEAGSAARFDRLVAGHKEVQVVEERLLTIRAELEALLDDPLDPADILTAPDRAHAVAAMILPFLRRMVDGATPIHLIEAPTVGSGKGLLTNLISIVATGTTCDARTMPEHEDEVRKMLTAELISGRPIILLDNVSDKKKLDSPALASIITAPRWTDRFLGESMMVTVPNNALWLMTGNNPKFSDDMPRRCVRVRIDPRVDRPWLRATFKHTSVAAWAKENRSALVHAVLTLVQAWIAAGRPQHDVRLGTFESWSATLGGVLGVAGIAGFLGNLDELYESADTEGQTWREFTAVWWEVFRGDPQKVAALNRLCEERELMLGARGDGSPRSQQTRLGIALGNKRDRLFDGRAVKRLTFSKHVGSFLYALVPVDCGEDPSKIDQPNLDLIDSIDSADLERLADLRQTSLEHGPPVLSSLETNTYKPSADVADLSSSSVCNEYEMYTCHAYAHTSSSRIEEPARVQRSARSADCLHLTQPKELIVCGPLTRTSGDGPQGSAVSARPAAAGRGAIDLASLPDEPYVPDGGAHD